MAIECEQAEKLLAAIFDPSDTILIRPIETWTESGKKRNSVDFRGVRYHRPATLIAAFAKILERSECAKTNLFFSVCPRFGGDSDQQFDLAWQIRIVRCLWADLDDCTSDEAIERCSTAGLPKPSIVISSGNGAHIYWILDQPYLIDDAGEPPGVRTEWVQLGEKKKAIKYFEADGDRVYLDDPKTGRPIATNRPVLSEKALHVQDLVAGIAAKIGGDHTQDLSRLLRVPGTMNRKDQRNGREPVPCQIVTIDAELRYSIETFAKYADASPVKKRRQRIAKVPLPTVRKPSAKRHDSLNELILECDVAEDRSRADFALCCFAIKHGIDSDFVWGEVQGIGKFAERGEMYFKQTWYKAELQVRTEAYEKAEKKAKTREKIATDETLGDNTDQGLPIIELPGGQSRVVDSAGALGRLLGETARIYRRGNVCRLEHENDTPVLKVLTPAHLPSLFETVARLVKRMVLRDGDSAEVAAVCSESTAKLILLSEAFSDEIPPIQVITKCPVLLERGTLLEITGYDRLSGVYAGGKAAEKVNLDEARRLFDVLLRDFRFKSPSDKSRAAAAVITPALVFGGLLGGRPAVDLVEADVSQAGKGFWHKCKAAIYNHVPQTVKQSKHTSLGGIEEEFNRRLIRGASFISLDNIRGKLDSPALESFLTEDNYIARSPYEQAEIDPRRVVVMMTSNKAEFTDDFGNRSSCTGILKQPPGHQFTRFPEGNLLAHIRANQPKFHGAVHALVREWYRLGKPRTNETRHDFREWSGALDWIVQNLLGLPPLIDGHQETKERMTNPQMNWLRDVALVVRQERRWSPISIATGGRGFLEENLGRGPEAKAGARAVIEEFFHPTHLLMGDVAKVSSLGEILTNQTIGVFVRTTLIRTTWVGKV